MTGDLSDARRAPARSPSDGSFEGLWQALLPIGRDPRTGGYRRSAWTSADAACREWFTAAAGARGMGVETDRNGNLWAWHGDPGGKDALVLGSHLDSVPDGGAYDGPLGIVSAFAALDALDAVPLRRPVAVCAFADEEGARFGVPCVGSRLLTGALDPGRARALCDRDGTTLAEALAATGHDPAGLGRDEERLVCIETYVELHIEQGRGLVDFGAPVGVGSGIWPHGRWRYTFDGRADHAGSTRMEDRADPMLTYAMTALAANKQARLAGARATFGRVEVTPNATNAIPARVQAWLDARAGEQQSLDALLEAVTRQAQDRAARDGTAVEVAVESMTTGVGFDGPLSERISVLLGGAPVLPTAAGHDAGILAAAGVPTAMLFVRNPTGISHSPAELAEPGDCRAGVEALRAVIAELAASPS